MKSDVTPTGVAVIGCGYWGVNYVRVFSELPEARVLAICDASQDRLRDIGKRFPQVQLITDLDELLANEAIKAVAVCTGATTHFQVAAQCLAAGKHVLVEKPMATTVAEAEQLIVLAETEEVTLMVGHTFLYNAGVRKVKQYIDRATSDPIYCLYARRTNLGPIRQDVNAIWDLAPHDISIFNYLLGETPQWVSAVGVKALRNCREDIGFISLGYGDHTLGNIHVSWADPYKVRELVVVSSQKRIVFDDLSATERVKIYEKGVTPTTPEAATFGEHQFQMRDGDIISPRVEVNEPLKTQCQHFLNCLQSGERPLTDGQAGLDVVRVLSAIDRSIAQQGAPVLIEEEKITPHNGLSNHHFAQIFSPINGFLVKERV